MEYQGQSPEGESSTAKTEASETKKSKGGPRKRVSQACDRCRSRKDKCDGRRPACTTCTANGRACSYDANVKKRGLPEGYVRGLEKLWGLAIRDVEGVEDNVLLVITGDDGNNTLNWNDESNSDNLVEIWRKSPISQELERLLSNVTSVDFGKRKRIDFEPKGGRQLGLKALETTRLPNTRADPGAQDISHDSLTFRGTYEKDRFIGRELESILSPSYANAASAKSTAASEVQDLPSETWHLLDVYFSYTHNWFPILEKHDILRTSYQYSQNRNNLSMFGHGSGDHAALWAAIAHAKFQHRAINNIPHAQGPVAEMVWTAERMYSYARSLVPNEEGVFELGHVQALLILALTNMGIGYLERSWFLVGQAVRAAIGLGLDRPSDDILKAFSKPRTKHVFLGCFVLDTLTAARLAHRPHLRAQDVENVGMVDVDGLEEWDPWTDCLTVRRGTGSRTPGSVLSTFNGLVQVIHILNEAICIPNSSRLQFTTSLLEKLHVWSLAQSPPLYLDSSAMNSETAVPLLPHQHNLHIAYFSTLAVSQMLFGQGSESVNLEPCTRSARQIVELLRQHSNDFGLLIVPPIFEYFIKTACDVVHSVENNLDGTHITLSGWKYSLDSCLSSMEQAWPVFESFKNSSSYQPSAPISSVRRESQVAYDLISGIQAANIPTTEKTSKSAIDFDVIAPFSPQTISNNGNVISANAWSSPNQSVNLGRLDLRAGSDTEIDPAFNEFAALDAMEWTGNWDQSLVNLGFTDRDSMDQDFYAMTREPDPLFANNIFQQLVANSNAEATNFLDGSIFGGARGFGIGFGDESEGIEAGQILQALSAAQDR